MKPRSPGRKQFPNDPMGSPRDWQKAANSPAVKRALADPGIANAIYHNFRQTGGNVPQASEPPVGFADGGFSSVDIQSRLRQAYQKEAQARAKSDPQGVDEAQQEIAELNKEQAASMARATAPGPVSFGNTNVSGQTMQGIQNLTGPVSGGNMAASILGGAAMGGASSGSGMGALVGAATAGLLNYFIRKNAQKKQDQQRQQMQSPGGAQGYGTYNGDPNATTTPPEQRRVLQPGGTTSPPTPPDKPATPTADTGAPGGQGLWMAGANSPSGNVVSSDGKTWKDARTGDPVDLGAVGVPSQIGSFGAPAAAAPDLMNLPMSSPGLDIPLQTLDPSMIEGMADGGRVEGHPMPHGMPIPILHTTIVIAAKPKGKEAKPEEKPVKKSMGGDLPQSERRPRRPNAIPPVRGPHPYGVESSGARLPHGRVQVPRGSGSAIRGKRFGGIF